MNSQPTDLERGRADFDFLVGDWVTEQHRSTKPLEDDAPWETFEAAVHVRKLPGGIGNIDYMSAPTRYQWTRVDDDNVAWEQAFSSDGGTTWIVNWKVTGRRMESAPSAWAELAATAA